MPLRTSSLTGLPSNAAICAVFFILCINLSYRATEHATTGVSPNKLMFGRELRGKFPEVKRQPKHPDDMVIYHNDKKQKLKMKQYADKRRHTAVMKIKVGDTVLCKQERKHSLTPQNNPAPVACLPLKQPRTVLFGILIF